MQKWITAVIVGSTLALSGCIFAPGDSRDWDSGAREPTIGQQLLDLDRARDEGIISDNEYERTRQRILDSVR